MKVSISKIVIIALGAFSMACADDEAQVQTNPKIPESININSQGLYPEGFVYDSQTEAFYVGSIHQGKIVKVTLSGIVSEFIESAELISVLGMAIDEENRELVICNSDPGFSIKTSGSAPPVLANIVRYSLISGEKTADYDLSQLSSSGSPHLVNDLVIDPMGNVYVTDSFSPIIYKITREGQASVLLSDESFVPAPNNFGLNGIEYHHNGYLLVSHYSQGAVYKVPLDDPDSFIKTIIDEDIHSADGIRLLDSNTLAIVSNVLSPAFGIDNIIYEVKTDDNWNTAMISSEDNVGPGNEFPTTIELADDVPYVIYSYLREILVEQNTSVESFTLRRVSFN